MPNGQVPMLEFGGKQLSQSMTIARFLADEFKLAGKTNFDRAEASMIGDLATDVLNRELFSILPITIE